MHAPTPARFSTFVAEPVDSVPLPPRPPSGQFDSDSDSDTAMEVGPSLRDLIDNTPIPLTPTGDKGDRLESFA